jgi:hypothetical protein
VSDRGAHCCEVALLSARIEAERQPCASHTSQSRHVLPRTKFKLTLVRFGKFCS